MPRPIFRSPRERLRQAGASCVFDPAVCGRPLEHQSVTERHGRPLLPGMVERVRDGSVSSGVPRDHVQIREVLRRQEFSAVSRN